MNPTAPLIAIIYLSACYGFDLNAQTPTPPSQQQPLSWSFFSYDAMGNRILRNPRQQTPPIQQTLSVEFDVELNIYPNPTTGIFQLSLTNLLFDNSCVVYLSSSTGQEILSANYVDSAIEFDISGQPAGIYIINVVVDGVLLETNSKIIKL